MEGHEEKKRLTVKISRTLRKKSPGFTGLHEVSISTRIQIQGESDRFFIHTHRAATMTQTNNTENTWGVLGKDVLNTMKNAVGCGGKQKLKEESLAIDAKRTTAPPLQRADNRIIMKRD
jgi:hypothetical protein